jgi:hypothetical protein
MRDTEDSYVPKAQGATPASPEKNKGGSALWVAAVVLLTLGITTAAAITKIRAPMPDLARSQSSNFFKAPFSGGFEEALY